MQILYGLSFCSAGLAVRSKISHKKSTNSDALKEIHKMIRDNSNIQTIASEQRIDDFDYPVKMRNMQKYTVDDLARSDKLREKVRFYKSTIFISYSLHNIIMCNHQNGLTYCIYVTVRKNQ